MLGRANRQAVVPLQKLTECSSGGKNELVSLCALRVDGAADPRARPPPARFAAARSTPQHAWRAQASCRAYGAVVVSCYGYSVQVPGTVWRGSMIIYHYYRVRVPVQYGICMH